MRLRRVGATHHLANNPAQLTGFAVGLIGFDCATLSSDHLARSHGPPWECRPRRSRVVPDPSSRVESIRATITWPTFRVPCHLCQAIETTTNLRKLNHDNIFERYHIPPKLGSFAQSRSFRLHSSVPKIARHLAHFFEFPAMLFPVSPNHSMYS